MVTSPGAELEVLLSLFSLGDTLGFLCSDFVCIFSNCLEKLSYQSYQKLSYCIVLSSQDLKLLEVIFCLLWE